MNAFTPMIRNSEAFGLAGPPHEALSFLARGFGAVSGPASSRQPGGTLQDEDRFDRQPSSAIPVFRHPVSGKRLAASVRSPLPRDVWMQSRDMWMQHHIATALHAESWIDADFVGVSVQDGIVHVSGEVDSMHAKTALLRIAAATPGTAAIVDSLWIACE